MTALSLEKLREFVITLFNAPKSSLENPSYSHRSGSRSILAISHGQLDDWMSVRATGRSLRTQEKEDSSTFARTFSGSMMKSSAIG